jgi:hypothetical protein
MDRHGGTEMDIRLVTDKKIAETSSKGNQEKWFDEKSNKWYKTDMRGYEALSEALVSSLLSESNIRTETPFSFAVYRVEALHIHGRGITGCSSDNFLKEGQSIITVNQLLSKYLGYPLVKKLSSLPSNKKRIEYLVRTVAEVTELADFGAYLTLLFEIDSLFLNDDRHLNNIAVIRSGEKYDYCPVFDNGAALLSDTRTLPMDIMPKALIRSLVARPFNTSFTRQMNTARALFGKQLSIPKFSAKDISDRLEKLLPYYPKRDRELISDRVIECILSRIRFFS